MAPCLQSISSQPQGDTASLNNVSQFLVLLFLTCTWMWLQHIAELMVALPILHVVIKCITTSVWQPTYNCQTSQRSPDA